MFRVFNFCVFCVCFWEHTTLTPRDTTHNTTSWVRCWEEPSEVGLKVFSLSYSCCLVFLSFSSSSSSSSFDDDDDRMWLMCFVVYVSHFFSFSPDPLFLSSFPVERERANLCIISVRPRRRRFGAHLFLLSRYRSNASILILQNAFYRCALSLSLMNKQ